MGDSRGEEFVRTKKGREYPVEGKTNHQIRAVFGVTVDDGSGKGYQVVNSSEMG